MTLLDKQKASDTIEPMKISDAVRKAIETSGMSRYELAKRSGVSQAALSKFVNGRGMHIAILDKIAGPLGLRLTVKKSKRKAG
ncbi:MAG: helix-turn-helix domain-containing protein [Planctomycetes bacterium]|nr:helix-turn-helix domain-containing protein [Planctomycetota bacterium]